MKKKNLLASFPFHTLLLSIYPIVYLYSQNYISIPAQQTLRSMLISFAIVAFFLFGFRVILRDWQKAGLMTSLLAILFFSFGHVVIAQQITLSIHFNRFFKASVIAWVWLVLFLILSFLILRSRLPENTTIFLNLMTLILVLLPCLMVATEVITSRGGSQADIEQLAKIRGEMAAEAAVSRDNSAPQPDIYFIILDGYERADKLQQYYGYDNSAFIDALIQRGFYVATESRSNYLSTSYSLNTSMNMVYLHNFPKNTFRQARNNLRTNHVSDFLRSQGYPIVIFESSTEYTNDQYSDEFISINPQRSTSNGIVNPFEILLIRTTLALEYFYRDAVNNGFVDAINQELEDRRERIMYGLRHLPDYATQNRPHFLFLHIYSPHVPFLFGPDGSGLTYNPEMNYYLYQKLPQSYIKYYNDQITYLNSAILPVIDLILKKSGRPTVIVLQSDHGDDKYLNWVKRDTRGIDIRSAILNAVYFSDGDYSSLYPTMSPVNTYRLIFNHWFGTQYPILPDKVYAHEHAHATRPNEIPVFEDACLKYGICLP